MARRLKTVSAVLPRGTVSLPSMNLKRKASTSLRKIGTKYGAGRTRPYKRRRVTVKSKPIDARQPEKNAGELTYRSKNWKPYRYNLNRAVKELQKQRIYAIMRFQGVNRANDTSSTSPPGFFRCSFDVTASGTNTIVPLHFFNLTSVGVATGLEDAQCGRFLTLLQSGYAANTPLSMQQPDGSVNTSGNWRGERINSASFSVLPSQYVTTHWFDISLNLYGCNTQPTLYTIRLVRFTDDYLAMENWSGAQTQQNLNRIQRFWQSQARPLTYNPLMNRTPMVQGGMVVLREYRRLIQPTAPFAETDVVDKNPSSTVLKIRYADQRTRNHMSSVVGAANDELALQGDRWDLVTSTPSDVNENPWPKARLYLLITATNTTPVAQASETAADTPSYDMIIRKKISFMPRDRGV